VWCAKPRGYDALARSGRRFAPRPVSAAWFAPSSPRADLGVTPRAQFASIHMGEVLQRVLVDARQNLASWSHRPWGRRPRTVGIIDPHSPLRYRRRSVAASVSSANIRPNSFARRTGPGKFLAANVFSNLSISASHPLFQATGVKPQPRIYRRDQPRNCDQDCPECGALEPSTCSSNAQLMNPLSGS
jgi:hypothetical protein